LSFYSSLAAAQLVRERQNPTLERAFIEFGNKARFWAGFTGTVAKGLNSNRHFWTIGILSIKSTWDIHRWR